MQEVQFLLWKDKHTMSHLEPSVVHNSIRPYYTTDVPQDLQQPIGHLGPQAAVWRPSLMEEPSGPYISID